MIDSCRIIVDDFKKSASVFISYEIFFKILGAALLGPLVAWVVMNLIAMSGQSAVSNVEIAEFVLSPLGFVTLFAFAGLGAAVAFLGQAGVLLIQIGRLNGQPISAVQAVRCIFGLAPDLIKLSLMFVALFLIVAAPFLLIAGGVYFWLLSEFDINFYLSERPPEFKIAVGIGIVLVIGVVIAFSIVYAKTLFALPECVLKRKSPVDAMKTSLVLTQPFVKRIFLALIGWIVIVALFSGIIFGLVQVVEFIVLSSVGQSFTAVAVAIGLLLTFNFLCSLVGAVFGNLSQALLVGRLYWSRLQDPDMRLTGIEEPRKLRFKGLPKLGSDDTSVDASLGWLKTRRFYLIAVIGVMFASAGASYFLLSQVKFEDDVQVTAHRGSSKEAPENSLSAILLAIEDGADFAEIDVQETVDGTIVVMHDADLMRIAGQRKNIWDTTFAELSEIDAGSWFGESFAGERVPSLVEVIDAARGKIKLNVELKFNGHDEQLVARTMKVIEENDFQSQFVISSLNHKSLAEVKSIDESVPVGAIVGASIGDVSKMEADFIAINVKEVNQNLVRRVHRQGKSIHVWTVNDEAQMARMLDLGVDNILTDEPRKLKQLLVDRSSLSDTERLLLAFRKILEN